MVADGRGMGRSAAGPDRLVSITTGRSRGRARTEWITGDGEVRVTRIVIIGGGPAGYEAALAGAAYGADVTVVDADGVGGACVLWDCVPSKTFIASTGIRTEVRRAVDLGINLSHDDALVSLPQIHQRVRDLAYAQSADIRSRLMSEGVTIVAGRGRLADAETGLSTHSVVVTPTDANGQRSPTRPRTR